MQECVHTDSIVHTVHENSKLFAHDDVNLRLQSSSGAYRHVGLSADKGKGHSVQSQAVDQRARNSELAEVHLTDTVDDNSCVRQA